MRKNNMRTPEEKAKIIEEYLNGEQGLHYYERKYNIHYQVLHRWYNKYLEDGIDGYKILPIYHPSPISPKSYIGNVPIFEKLKDKYGNKQ